MRKCPRWPVLPLANTSGDDTASVLCDGFTEALITALGRIDGVRVIAAGTSMRYRDGATQIDDLARTAGANRVLEGSVARIGDQIRLTLRLAEASAHRVVWSDEYSPSRSGRRGAAGGTYRRLSPRPCKSS